MKKTGKDIEIIELYSNVARNLFPKKKAIYHERVGELEIWLGEGNHLVVVHYLSDDKPFRRFEFIPCGLVRVLDFLGDPVTIDQDGKKYVINLPRTALIEAMSHGWETDYFWEGLDKENEEGD